MSKKMNGSHKRSLRNLMINPRYQIRYTMWVTLTGFALVALQTAVFYFFTRENYSILVDLGPMTDESKQQLYKELWQILILLGAGSVVFLVIVGIMGLVFSHRTAGPLYHFERVFREIASGNPAARVHLRPHDDFQEVAKAFNTMMDSLKPPPKPRA